MFSLIDTKHFDLMGKGESHLSGSTIHEWLHSVQQISSRKQ